MAIGAPPIDENISIPTASAFVVAEKRLLGCALGSVNAHRDIPRFLELARLGKLDLAAMVTDRYELDDIDAAVGNLRDRKGVRTALRIAAA